MASHKHRRTPESEEALRKILKAGAPRGTIPALMGISQSHFLRLYSDILDAVPRENPEERQRERRIAEAMALAGIPEKRIAASLGINPTTLNNRHGEAMRVAQDHANANVVRALYHQAINGNTSAAIFWTRTQLGWSERHTVDVNHTGENVALYLPDNGRGGDGGHDSEEEKE